MYLVVHVDDFGEAIRRHDPNSSSRVAYYNRTRLPGAGEVVHLTYGVPGSDVIVFAETLIGDEDDFSDITHGLKQNGIETKHGHWTDRLGQAGAEQPSGGPARFWVGVVAYRSSDEEPGVWMDAFLGEPSDDAVLRAMFDEFVKSGDLAGASYDDFVSDAAPTVQIVASTELAGWLRQKGGA